MCIYLSAAEPHAAIQMLSPDSTGQAPAYVRCPSSTEEPGVELGHSEDLLGARCLPNAGQSQKAYITEGMGWLTSSVDCSP